MSARFEQLLRAGQLGPLTVGMRPTDVELVLGEPDARSQKTNPLLLKYGPLELTFTRTKSEPPQLVQIALSFTPGSGRLPDPVSIADWPIGADTTTSEFTRLLALHGIESAETLPGHEVILRSGVRATFSSDRLQRIGVLKREHPMFSIVKVFEAELGVPPGFLESLLNEGDDWTFVLKVHALLEAALTHLLTVALGDQVTPEHSGSIPMNQALTLATEHRLVDPGRAMFLRALGRIRNAFVHDVRSVHLRVEDFVNSLGPQEQSDMWRDLMRGYTLEPMIDDSGRLIPTEDFVAARPRFAIWISSISALALIYRTKALDQTERERLFSALSTMEPLRRKPGSQRSR